MVARLAELGGRCLLWADSEAVKPPILQMPGATRAKVLAVLAGLVILGFAMMALAWLGARMTRRYMNRCDPEKSKKDSAPGEHDWARRPADTERTQLNEPRES